MAEKHCIFLKNPDLVILIVGEDKQNIWLSRRVCLLARAKDVARTQVDGEKGDEQSHRNLAHVSTLDDTQSREPALAGPWTSRAFHQTISF
jgi:hypothetical protein